MSFQTGTATSVADLLTGTSGLAAFATSLGSPGWVQDYVASDRLFLHYAVGAIAHYMGFRWDQAGTPANVGIYQATGFVNSSTLPGNQTNDSGQGAVASDNATLGTGRCAPLVNGSMPFWFFGSRTSSGSSTYVHAVVQVATDTFVHFGFGTLGRIGNAWTGGEYSYGHAYKATDQHGSAVNTASSFLLDALCDGGAGAPFRATVRAQFLPNPAPSVWGVCGKFSTGPGTDRSGATRSAIMGGFRGGFLARAFGRWKSDTSIANVPIYPIGIMANQNSGADGYLLGSMRDIGGVNIQFFNAGDVVSIGGDDWVLFPTQKKSGDNVVGSTYWSGIAYKVIP